MEYDVLLMKEVHFRDMLLVEGGCWGLEEVKRLFQTLQSKRVLFNEDGML